MKVTRALRSAKAFLPPLCLLVHVTCTRVSTALQDCDKWELLIVDNPASNCTHPMHEQVASSMTDLKEQYTQPERLRCMSRVLTRPAGL
jgi:hypothetical protein